MSRFSAVIFDLDGTLIDSAPLWPQIDANFFRSLLGDDRWRLWRTMWLAMRAEGVQNHDDAILERLVVEFGLTESVADIKRQREDDLCAAYRNSLMVFPGAHESIRRLSAMGVSLAIASGMSVRVITAIVDQMGWREEIKALASTHEVKKNKPHPAVYRLVATRLGQSPTCCFAIENEVKGYQSAYAAGMTCAFVPDTARRCEEAWEHVQPDDVFASLDAVMSRYF